MQLLPLSITFTIWPGSGRNLDKSLITSIWIFLQRELQWRFQLQLLHLCHSLVLYSLFMHSLCYIYIIFLCIGSDFNLCLEDGKEFIQGSGTIIETDGAKNIVLTSANIFRRSKKVEENSLPPDLKV